MPRRRHYSQRVRSSSQSSVEIQVEEHEAVITTTISPTSCTQSLTPNDSLVVPKPEFLQLLRNVGAKGDSCRYGEVFTLKKLGFYLKEYIKSRQLWDIFNPVMVHCGQDPLGAVFGVPTFSVSQVKDLLRESTWNLLDIRKCHTDDSQSQLVGKAAGSMTSQREGEPLYSLTSEPSLPVTSVEATVTTSRSPSYNRHGHNRRKQKHRSSESGSGESRRERTSSISIFYSDCEGSSTSYPYILQWEINRDSDTEEVLSIQSKETAFVSDSSDDYWFLEEDVTVEMSDNGFSLEFQSTHSDPPFEVEYEVESEASAHRDDSDHSDHTSEEEEAETRPHDSDVEFWADSESSDWDTDSTDIEISDSDKWECSECQLWNRPLTRHCDRCWRVRDGWLPDRITPNKDPVSSHDLLASFNKSLKRNHDTDLYSSSENEASDCYFNSKRLKTVSCSTEDVYCQPRSRQGYHWEVSVGDSPCTVSEMYHNTDNDKISPSITTDTHTSKSQTFSGAKNVLSQQNGTDRMLMLAFDTKTTNLTQSTPIMCYTEVSPDSLAGSQDSGVASSHEIHTEGSRLQDGRIVSLSLTQANWSQDSGLHEVSFDQSDGTQHGELQDGSDNDIIPPSPQGNKSFRFGSQGTRTIKAKQSVSDSGKTETLMQDFASVLHESSNPIKPSHCTVSTLQESIPGLQCSEGLCDTSVVNCKPLTEPFTTGRAQSLTKKSQVNSAVASCKAGCSVQRREAKSPEAGCSTSLKEADKPDTSALCSICLSSPKDASIIHGHTGHQVCCYKCAKRLYRRGKPCPVCRRRIQKVIRNYIL